MPAYPRLPRITAERTLLAALLLGANACSSDVTAPLAASLAKAPKKHDKPGTPVQPVAVPAFLFVSNASGAPQIYRFRNDTVARLTFSDMPDVNPSVAGTKMAFASYRDGNGEIYMADAEMRDVRRLTTSPSTDDEPALSPQADRVAFASYRTGTSRIYLMDSTGAGQVALETGASANVPETRPSWSPSADRIVFASSRTGTSQIFVVSANGGMAEQLTQESVGAFDPVFSADGSQIIYTAWLSSARLRVVTVATGLVSDYASDNTQSVGEGTCDDGGCIATAEPYSDAGDIVHVSKDGARRTLVTRAGHDSRAARLKP